MRVEILRHPCPPFTRLPFPLRGAELSSNITICWIWLPLPFLLLPVHPKFTVLLGCPWSLPGFLGVKNHYGAEKLNTGEILNKIKSRQKVLPIEGDSLWEGGDSLLSLKMSYTVYCIFVSLGKAKWLCFKSSLAVIYTQLSILTFLNYKLRTGVY